ncbi:MAG TPA: RHS repeat-associated core domain-containing protein [Bacteroidales bacterium]|nr:RHS repeat-associated core domain-containing protein [Bacteroidales bacterium]
METLRYFYHFYHFYHPDHLGSTSWVTDSAKNGVQYCEYLPYGEPLVDQRSTTWSSRYTFSGKERDSETGYSYFGARYYHSDLSIWLSVDPMSDKYPNLTPYAYCANNPVILVDPDGEKIIFGLFAFRAKRLFNRIYRSADAETKAKYDMLKNSSINYRINIKSLGDRQGYTTYNFNKKRVDINISTNSKNQIGTLGDELETAYQFQTNRIGFVQNNDGTVGTLGYDMRDEADSKRAAIKAIENVNSYEGINIPLDNTLTAFKKSDTGQVPSGMTRDQLIENYFNTDPSTKQYNALFQPAIPGIHNGGGNMSNSIPGTGGYSIQQIQNAKDNGQIKDFIINQ